MSGIWLRKSEGGKKLLGRAGMEVEDGDPGARGWEHPAACGAEELPGSAGTAAPWVPRAGPALAVLACSSILPGRVELQKL